MTIIGHFAVGLAAKPLAPKVPLYALLLATLVLDFLTLVNVCAQELWQPRSMLLQDFDFSL